MERKQAFSGGKKQETRPDRNYKAKQGRKGGGYRSADHGNRNADHGYRDTNRGYSDADQGYRDADHGRRDTDRESYQGANRGGYSVGYRDDNQIGKRGRHTGPNRKPYQGANREPYKDANRESYQGAGRGPYKGSNRGSYQGADRESFKDANGESYQGAGRESYKNANREPYQGAGRGRNASGSRGGFAAPTHGPSQGGFRGRHTEENRTEYQGGGRARHTDTDRDAFQANPSAKGARRVFRGNSPDKAMDADKHEIVKKDAEATQEDLERLEGRNSVLEALKAGRSINRILVQKGEREGSINQIIALAKQNRIILQEVDRAKLDSLSLTQAHQGVIAFAAAKDYVSVEDILDRAKASGKPPFIIILDEISDAYNLGSILRSADAAGAHGVIIPKRRAIGLTAAVSKASAGAIEYVPVARVTNLVQTIESLKKQNIWVVGTDSSGEKPYFSSDLKGPVAVVIGSEGEGMGRLVRDSCDFTVNIPMKGSIASLNAAVAGALVMFEILRQRSTP